MSELMALPLREGGVVVVEVDEELGGVVKAARPGEIVGRAAQTLESALDSVSPAARAIVHKLREAGPQSIIVEFGLKFTAEVGAIITKTAGECNMKVTLSWDQVGGPGL